MKSCCLSCLQSLSHSSCKQLVIVLRTTCCLSRLSPVSQIHLNQWSSAPSSLSCSASSIAYSVRSVSKMTWRVMLEVCCATYAVPLFRFNTESWFSCCRCSRNPLGKASGFSHLTGSSPRSGSSTYCLMKLTAACVASRCSRWRDCS